MPAVDVRRRQRTGQSRDDVNRSGRNVRGDAQTLARLGRHGIEAVADVCHGCDFSTADRLNWRRHCPMMMRGASRRAHRLMIVRRALVAALMALMSRTRGLTHVGGDRCAKDDNRESPRQPASNHVSIVS